MSRPIKDGVDYFPFDIDFFNDRKIQVLQGRYGSDGIALYMYLLCEIYRDKGYYTLIDEDFYFVAANALNMTYEKISQMLNFLLKRSLFNDTLFKSDKVLTSRGIQRRYQEAVKGRALKKAVEVEGTFWMLNPDETKSFIKVHGWENNSENNPDNSENKNTNKIKENKSKVNDINRAFARERRPQKNYGRFDPTYDIGEVEAALDDWVE